MAGPDTTDTHAFHEFERAGWERVAGDYHRYFADLTTGFIDPLLDAGGVAQGSRVLDVATGPGYVAAAAARRGADVVGVDFAAAAVAVARQQHPDLAFKVGSAEELPWPAEEFDAVLMNFGLLHVARPERALAEAHRVLRAGGRLAFTVWGDPETCMGFKIILDAIAAHGETNVPLPEGPPFFRFSDPQECTRVLADAGFKDASVDEIHVAWKLSDPDTLFETFLHGAVRTGALLQAQQPAARDAIRRATRREVLKFADAGGLRLPMAAVLSAARK